MMRHLLWGICLAALLPYLVAAAAAQSGTSDKSGASDKSNVSESSLQTGPKPPDAVILGNGWRCRAGFRLDDGGCVPVVAPPNATIHGNGWSCNPGYVKTTDNLCRRIK